MWRSRKLRTRPRSTSASRRSSAGALKTAAIPEALRRLNFIFFDDPARFEASADRLAEALQTDIGWIRQHTEFGEAARHWSAAGRPGGLLLRSPALEEAERWIASRPHGAPEPTAETQAFVAASRRGATRRRNILTGSLAAGLVVALALAGLAYWQRGIAVEEQRIANEQRQLAEQQRQRAEDYARGRDQNRQQSGLRPGAAVPQHGGGSRHAHQGHSRPRARAAGAAYPNPAR